MSYVPQSYDEWQHCITIKCGIPLTPDYIAMRIAALENTRDFHTEKFVARWGATHHARTLGWFREAQTRLAGPSGH